MTVYNWKRSIKSSPQKVVEATNVERIVEVLTNPQDYPAPVRAIGSNHSTTRCGVADGGTLLNMSRMNQIVEIDEDNLTVTAQAGALYIDVAEALEARNLQFYVNVELGNLSIGSAACGGTKDASMPGEFGQVCSYAIGMKLVRPDGKLIEVTEDQPELLRIMRSSYGLLGVIYEVIFKVKKLEPMAVRHKVYSLDRFVAALPDLTTGDESMMLYMAPFLDKVTVEFRKKGRAGDPRRPYIWGLRNWVWRVLAPTVGALATRLIPVGAFRYGLIDWFNQTILNTIKGLLKGNNTTPTDQIIRYPKRPGLTAYTFSIWAFPEENYADIIRAYFEFCHTYNKDFGYRCNLMNVGYRIAQDDSALFSYSTGGTVMTLDPVSTGNRGWENFLLAFNDFCSELGGVPLFNQSRSLTPEQVRRAFGSRIEEFSEYRRSFDPDNRLLNDYFEELLGN